MHDDADTQLALGLADVRKARVVFGQEPFEGRDGIAEQYCLWCLFHGVDEDKNSVTAIDEWVTIWWVDSRRAQRFIEQLIDLVAKLGLNGIDTGGGLRDVERDDGPVMGQASWRGRFHQVSSRERSHGLPSVGLRKVKA
jgi:hypothetical protein